MRVLANSSGFFVVPHDPTLFSRILVRPLKLLNSSVLYGRDLNFQKQIFNSQTVGSIRFVYTLLLTHYYVLILTFAHAGTPKLYKQKNRAIMAGSDHTRITDKIA